MDGRTPFEIGQSQDVVVTTVHALPGESSVILPKDGDFLRADFAREGFDLILDTGADGTVVIPDYFLRLSPPDLHTEDGAVLPHHIVRSMAGPMAPGQVAQIGFGGPSAAQTGVGLGAPIGSISDAQGAVTVVHPDGTEAMLVTGDPIFQGDVMVTGSDGSVSVIFVDDTVFSLDVDGRMIMDEMVYDPDTETGTFNTMVVQGVFSFVSGKVAKTSPDGMIVNTPTATIGIRGSTVLGDATNYKVALVRDVDGNVGEIVVSNGAGQLVLNQAGASTTVLSSTAAPGPVQILSQAEIQSSYGGSLTRLVKAVAKQAEKKAEQAQD
ncbi:MAG: FecR domain-containing protein, partial [Magnetovibrio sp.]|nr:FecR domain-containing protein [Magnetovibrio sp.]